MPNIISRYSHANFRRSLGRRRYSGRHGFSVPALAGICNSDMFEISSASRKSECSAGLRAEHRSHDDGKGCSGTLDCLVPRPVGQRQWSGQTKGELPLSAFVGIPFMGTFEQRSHNSHIKKAPRVIAGAYLLLMSTRFARNHDSVGVMVCAVAGRTATAKPCQHPWMPDRFDQDLDHPI